MIFLISFCPDDKKSAWSSFATAYERGLESLYVDTFEAVTLYPVGGLSLHLFPVHMGDEYEHFSGVFLAQADYLVRFHSALVCKILHGVDDNHVRAPLLAQIFVQILKRGIVREDDPVDVAPHPHVTDGFKEIRRSSHLQREVEHAHSHFIQLPGQLQGKRAFSLPGLPVDNPAAGFLRTAECLIPLSVEVDIFVADVL